MFGLFVLVLEANAFTLFTNAHAFAFFSDMTPADAYVFRRDVHLLRLVGGGWRRLSMTKSQDVYRNTKPTLPVAKLTLTGSVLLKQRIPSGTIVELYTPHAHFSSAPRLSSWLLQTTEGCASEMRQLRHKRRDFPIPFRQVCGDHLTLRRVSRGVTFFLNTLFRVVCMHTTEDH